MMKTMPPMVGRAALGVMGLRAVVADELAPVEALEQPDEERRREQGEEQRERRRRRAGRSRGVDSPRCRSPRNRSPADFDDFTSTTSPGRSSSRRRSYAASASVTSTDSPSHEPSRPAASVDVAGALADDDQLADVESHRETARGDRAPPGRTRPARPSRRAPRPSAGRAPTIWARVFSAAAVESGLAL